MKWKLTISGLDLKETAPEDRGPYSEAEWARQSVFDSFCALQWEMMNRHHEAMMDKTSTDAVREARIAIRLHERQFAEHLRDHFKLTREDSEP